MSGDMGVNLMVCIFVVYPGSCDNLIAEEAVQKLGLKIENRPKHYKLQWLKKGTEVTVSKRVLVTFSVGTTYKDSVWCDMVPMDTYHLLLGRPWEYDRNTTHNGRANTYNFLFGGVKIALMPNKPKELVNKPTGTLLTLSQSEDELEMGDEVHRAVHDNLVRGNSKYKQDADQVDFEVGDFMWVVLTKDRFPVGEYNKLSTKKIGPLEIIEKIDSNAYRLKLPSHIRCFDVFNVKHLLSYHGDSSNDDLVVNSRANFVYPGGMMQAQLCVWLSGYTSALQIADVFGSDYTFALQIANVFGSGSTLVCLHLFGLLRIETSSSTESALWDAPLCVCFSVFVYFMFGKLSMFTAAALAGEIQTSPKLLAQTALSVALDMTRTTSSSMVKLAEVHGMSLREISAMKDCIELLGDSVYELKQSLDEMTFPGSKDSGLVVSDIQTWVSSAMTDEETCSEGFADDPKMKGVVRGKIVNVAHLISNALALINNYASLGS
ncbi:putative reverse transcriptase domain-containing protein [Tanacetum coccineum]